MIALFRLVGSKNICNFKLPNLSLLFTRTKLFIHGVASCIGLRMLAFSILSISCLKFSFRWTATGQQGVCLGGMLGSNWILYGGPGNLPMSSNTSGYCVRIYSALVMSLETSCFFTTENILLLLCLSKVRPLVLSKIDSLIFLAKLCPSLHIIWKLLWLVGLSVWLLWWWMAEGALYMLPVVYFGWPLPVLTSVQIPQLTLSSLDVYRAGYKAGSGGR